MNGTSIYEVIKEALRTRDYKRIQVINSAFYRYSFSASELKELSSKIEQQITDEMTQSSSDEINKEFLDAMMLLSHKVSNDITAIEEAIKFKKYCIPLSILVLIVLTASILFIELIKMTP